jgi:hypothetical protein
MGAEQQADVEQEIAKDTKKIPCNEIFATSASFC